MSQSANPLPHVATSHFEAAHIVDAACGVSGQVVPHAPQFLTSLVVSTSQPLAGLLSQSANPGSHLATVQFELTQAAVPCAALHFMPQEPQLLTSLVVAISQPSP